MTDELYDRRDKGWFHIDHALIEEYGPRIGAIGIAVYTYLAHKADRQGVSWPSYNTVAAALAISRSTALREVRQLEQHGLIRIETVTPAGKRPHNVYTLVTIGVTDTPVSEIHQSPMVSQIHQCPPDTRNGVTDTPEMVSQIHPIKNQLTRTKKQEPIVSLRSTARAKPPRVLLADFQPTPAMIEQAVEFGVPREQIALQTESWRDYHMEKGTIIKDFPASWRRWMRNQVVYAERDAARSRASPNGRKDYATQRDEERTHVFATWVPPEERA